MMKLDPTVRKETGYITIWVLALSVLMEAAFLLLQRWDMSVLTGNLFGIVAAIGNYLLLGITVTKAAAGPREKIALKVRSSMTARLLGQAALCAIAIGVFHTNVYATILPLLFPRVGIAFRPLVDKKFGKGAADTEGSDLLD